MDVPTEQDRPSHTPTEGLHLPPGEILDQLPAAIYTCDVEGRITYYNRAAADLWGREPVIGKEFWCGSFRLSKADGTPVALDRCPMAVALKSGQPAQYDDPLIVWRPDGERRYVTVNPQLIFDEAGTLCGAVNHVTDITARVRAERERSASELTLSRLIALLPVGVASCDAEGRITFFNQKATELWGTPPKDGDLVAFLSDFQITLANGNPLPLGAPFLEHLLREGQSLRDVTLTVRRPDGSRITLGASIECLHSDNGGDHGAVGMFQDISERERNEQAIRHLAAIVESSEDAIVSKNLNGIITTWNRGAEKLFGYTAEEIIGRPITLLIPPDREWEEPGIIARVRRGERVLPYETIRITKDGRLIDISVTVSPIKDQRGNIVGASKIARDIRRIKEYEARLKREDRRKNEFIATLAHELRNPLAPLRHGLEIMHHAHSASETVSDARAMMGRQLEQMVRLIDDLLDVSRITRGKFQLRMDTVNVLEVVRNAIESCQPLILDAGHSLTTDLPDGRLEITADAVRLTQILINLLRNAIKYTPSGGKIHLSVHNREDGLVIEVRDNGIGIPPQMLPEIFEPFTQVGNPDDLSGGGLGIGLTLVKQLVEMHGGTVVAHSDGGGRGSTFSIHLPSRAQAQSSRSGSRNSSRSGKISRRILIADDNKDAASSLAHLMTILGHETMVAFDGQEAVERAMEFNPEFVVLDIGMPKMNGYDACRKIREQFAEGKIVIIALTGWSHEEDRGLAEEAGFDHHLTKPLDLRALETILRPQEP